MRTLLLSRGSNIALSPVSLTPVFLTGENHPYKRCCSCGPGVTVTDQDLHGGGGPAGGTRDPGPGEPGNHYAAEDTIQETETRVNLSLRGSEQGACSGC